MRAFEGFDARKELRALLEMGLQLDPGGFGDDLRQLDEGLEGRRIEADRRGLQGLKAGGRLAHSEHVGAAFGSPAAIGRLFLTDHLLAFEITSIVLLVAAIGGVILGAHSRRATAEVPPL